MLITTERWRGFDHGALARTLAAEQGFTVVITDLDTDPASIGNRFASRRAIPPTLGAAPPLDDDAGALDLHSSGTTADPKGVRHTDRSVMHGAAARSTDLGVAADDVNPIAVPVSHIGGMHHAHRVRCVTGSSSSLFDSLRPDDDARAHGRARRDRARQSRVPFFLAYFDAQRRHGDEPLFPELRVLHRRRRADAGRDQPRAARGARRARDRQLVGPHRVPRRHLRARPTTPPRCSTAPPGPRSRASRCAWSTTTGRRRAGEEGELRLRGPQCFLGYVDASLDADAFDDDGWFRTGDLGVVDADGNVRITGRHQGHHHPQRREHLGARGRGRRSTSTPRSPTSR